MLSKCTNPDCFKPFLYLRQGKLYQVELETPDGLSSTSGSESKKKENPESLEFARERKPSRRLEFFWLCSECSSSMTLAFQKGRGVIAVPNAPSRQVAIAA
jgi:hypothetical protein